MPDPWGFMQHRAEHPPRRPVDVRIQDWREVYEPADADALTVQAARCMDCGIPFCHSDTAGCPLGNLIPEWNDLVRTGQWQAASERLHATNNFPEFTGRLCPAPCESACVLGIIDDPVTIEDIEKAIADRAWAEGWVVPQPSPSRTGRRVAVVGSGPSGLAAAQQLTRAGHEVTVFERDDRPGGLLRYGIPEFKMEKKHLDRRLAQMVAEGTRFLCGVAPSAEVLRAEFDAVVLAVGAGTGRDVELPGRELPGVHLAMEHLVPANRASEGRRPGSSISAEGKHVVIIGGGDTGADCLGTAHRQGAASVTQLDLYPAPPTERDEQRTPWPTWPYLLRSYAAHEEGGEREFAVSVDRFVADAHGRLAAVEVREVTVERVDGRRVLTPVGDTVHRLPCELALLAIGFEGVTPAPLFADLGIELDDNRRIPVRDDWQTAAPGVFACGDAVRGASLVVWAIAEGRAAAAAVDVALTGATELPAPVYAGQVPLR